MGEFTAEAASCQFCAISGIPGWDNTTGRYWLAAGCLKQLHARIYLVCERHLAAFRDMFERIPCADCTLIPGQEAICISEILWEKHE